VSEKSDERARSERTAPLACVLVCGGRFHDFDFARRELLGVLGEDPRVRTRAFEDYAHTSAIASADFLVSYTCDVRPSAAEEAAVRAFVARGGRWLALHGTNAILDVGARIVTCPRSHDTWMRTLGSRFLAHPPIAPYRVTVAEPGHPLVRGIEPFDTDDELYLSEITGDLRVLLETRFTGHVPGFADAEWRDDAARPVLYLHQVGEGEVLYLTLGHCRGHHDMRPLVEWYPRVERGSWALPVFRELLRRGVAWAKAAP
jgi:hypothetical protein